MKPSEYYEKFYKLRMPDGSMVSPKPLTDVQRDFLDNACLQNMRNVIFSYNRKRTRYINIEMMMAEIEKLPDFLKADKKEHWDIVPLELSETTKKWLDRWAELTRLAEQARIGMFIPVNQPDRFGNPLK